MTFTALLFDIGSVEIARIALVVGFIILSLSVHEWAHAYTAHKLGDDTAKNLGRMTPNPIVHIDPLMTIAIPALLLILTNGQFVFGGAKPVPVDPRNFRHPHAANALVAVAGPLSNFALAFVFIFAHQLAMGELGYRSNELLPWVLEMSAVANVVLGVFNLLPIPPLDGSRVMAWLLPSALREPYVQLERFGMLLVLGVWYVVPGVKDGVYMGVNQLQDWLNWVTGGRW
jgi:Zn-dependent protease